MSKATGLLLVLLLGVAARARPDIHVECSTPTTTTTATAVCPVFKCVVPTAACAAGQDAFSSFTAKASATTAACAVTEYSEATCRACPSCSQTAVAEASSSCASLATVTAMLRRPCPQIRCAPPPVMEACAAGADEWAPAWSFAAQTSACTVTATEVPNCRLCKTCTKQAPRPTPRAANPTATCASLQTTTVRDRGYHCKGEVRCAAPSRSCAAGLPEWNVYTATLPAATADCAVTATTALCTLCQTCTSGAAAATPTPS